MNNPTLCLNMIVKNESKIISRLFDSVLQIIDCYCICDTGSTDNTIELITQYFADKNIPGKIVQEPFKNFCHNRNFALQSALGMSDFILLLDADMILDIKKFDKQILLNADSFNLLQGNNNFYYQNMRIIRNNGLYNYCGVTHEYINVPPNNKTLSISKNLMFINDVGDGGAKSDKSERDIRLLTQGIIDEPNNGRYYFYLANTYYDIGKYEVAIINYNKRIEMGGWQQEIWYSKYRIGLCYLNANKNSEAVYYFLDAYNYLPERLEALYEIIKHYRLSSKHKIGVEFYNIANKILMENHDKDGYLFLHNDVYNYKLTYEYTILAAYTGVKNINNECVKLLNNCLDKNISYNLLSNLKFYKNIWQRDTTINLDNKINIIVDGINTLFTSSSSCLIPKQNNKYDICIRYVNYYIYENGQYVNNKNIITINCIKELNNEFAVTNEKWFDYIDSTRLYSGVEDVRIFNDKGTIRFIGTGYHKSNKIGIVEGILNKDIDSNKLHVNEIIPQFKEDFECEKNWVYVDYKDSNYLIYKWHPLTLCQIDREKNVLIEKETKNMPNIFSFVRGSSCGFSYNNEIWFVVHLVSYEQPRHYYHLICVFDKNMNLLRYSAPFKFESEPIEYTLSLVVEDNRVLIPYSTWDRTTRIGVYSKEYVESMLRYRDL
jgi:hypothetical protein